MAVRGAAALQTMKDQRQIQRIHAIYNELITELNKLDDEQNEVIKKIRQHIDHDKIKNILTSIHND